MYRGLRVAVVVPAHNEAALLPVTLAGVPDFVDLIVVVDDASVDATAAVAAREPRVDLVRHPHNLGVGGAIVSGYRRALRRGAEAVVVMGADAQMDPAELPRLLEPVALGRADYVKGDRLGHPEVTRRMPWVRFIGNHVLSRLTSWATGYGVRDAQCGYTAARASTLARLPLHALYPRYGFPNDLLAKLAAQGAAVQDVQVSPIYGEERSGLRPWRVVLPISWILLRAGLQRLGRLRRSAGLALPAAGDAR